MEKLGELNKGVKTTTFTVRDQSLTRNGTEKDRTKHLSQVSNPMTLFPWDMDGEKVVIELLYLKFTFYHEV